MRCGIWSSTISDAASLANAQAAADETTRRAHLVVAKHFYLLAEEEISRREAKRRA